MRIISSLGGAGSFSAVRFKATPIATAILATMICGQANAYQFQAYGIDGSIDSTVSYGALWRMEKQDPSLIAISNGGTSRDPNGDDGDLNYKNGNLVNSTFKLDEELQLKYLNYAFFARGNYFYDTQIAKDLGKFGPEAQEHLKDRASLLDLFASGSFNVASHNLNVRIGNQVINWGESTFIQNGLSVINSVDLTKLRQPGSELKDALLPTPAVQLSIDLTSRLSFAGFVLGRFDPIILDPTGAYFSTNDVVGDDNENIYLNYGRDADQHQSGFVYVTRQGDQRPDGADQFGASFHYIASSLGDTEFGVYYLHYHSHIPMLSMTKQDSNIPAAGIGILDNSAHFFLEYPKGINVIGGSFSTSLPYGIAAQGEYTYRPNLPVQLPGPDLVQSVIGAPSEIAPNPTTIAPSSYIQGYRNVAAHQVQFTLTDAIAQPFLGADQLILLSEFGADYLDLPDDLKFAGPGVALPSRPQDAFLANGSYQQNGFATKFSWGYRIVSELRYLDVFRSLNVTPRAVFSHDVTGVGPNFNQETKAATAGVQFDYLENWRADVAYTAFFGGRNYGGTDAPSLSDPTPIPAGQPLTYNTSANPLRDRDFISASLSYSF